MSELFNGWSTQETWSVDLYIKNDEDLYSYWLSYWEGDEGRGVDLLADKLQEEVSTYDEFKNTNMAMVNWLELAYSLQVAAFEEWKQR